MTDGETKQREGGHCNAERGHFSGTEFSGQAVTLQA